MPVDFYFSPPTHSIPSLLGLRFRWAEIPRQDVAEMIALEEQYLNFHLFVLDSVRHTRVGLLHAPPYESKLGLSVRAGSIKAALLVSASIAEAALRSHAEKRGYRLSPDPRRRTFGNVLSAWKNHGKPRKDVSHIWDDLENLRDVRNNIHLFKAAADPYADFGQVLAKESDLLKGALNIVDEMASLKSP